MYYLIGLVCAIFADGFASEATNLLSQTSVSIIDFVDREAPSPPSESQKGAYDEAELLRNPLDSSMQGRENETDGRDLICRVERHG